jgi:hypothetical protein
MCELDRLELEADRLMHAYQRAEDAGNWPHLDWLSQQWSEVEARIQALQETEPPTPGVATVLAMGGSESETTPCMCGGGAETVCTYCGGLVGVSL